MEPWELTPEECCDAYFVLDHYGNKIQPGSEVSFISLYGLRTVTATAVGTDEKGIFIEFEPLQIGPEKAFKPVSRWYDGYSMMTFCLASDHDNHEAIEHWIFSIGKGGRHLAAVSRAISRGFNIPENVKAIYPCLTLPD